MLRGDGRPSKGFTGRAGKPNGTAWGGWPEGSRRKPEETCQGVGEGRAGDSRPSWAHLADAVDAEVTAGLALVAGGAIDHSVPQLLSKVLIRGPAVQLAGVHWGPKQRSHEGQPGQESRRPPGRPPPRHPSVAGWGLHWAGSICKAVHGSQEGAAAPADSACITGPPWPLDLCPSRPQCPCGQ